MQIQRLIRVCRKVFLRPFTCQRTEASSCHLAFRNWDHLGRSEELATDVLKSTLKNIRLSSMCFPLAKLRSKIFKDYATNWMRILITLDYKKKGRGNVTDCPKWNFRRPIIS